MRDHAPPPARAWNSALWVAACASLLLRLFLARHSVHAGIDIRPLLAAGSSALSGHSPFGVRSFVYPPSSLLLGIGYAALGFGAARLATYAAIAVAVPLSLYLSCRLAGLRAGRWPAGAVAALVLASSATLHGVLVANAELLVLPALAGLLLLARAGRWAWAGALLGASLAVKPILLPLLLLFVFARRWGPLLLAVLVPAACSGAALAFVASPGRFFTTTLPYLLGGEGGSPINSSLLGLGQQASLPPSLITAVRMAVIACGIWLALAVWRSGHRDRLVWSSGLLLLTFFVGSGWALPHYTVFLTPLLALGIARLGRPSWAALAVLTCYLALAWPTSSLREAAVAQGLAVAGLWGCLAAVTVHWLATARSAGLLRAGAGPPAPEATREVGEGL